jgi:DNA-binding MarR family transcriptional regulator
LTSLRRFVIIKTVEYATDLTMNYLSTSSGQVLDYDLEESLGYLASRAARALTNRLNRNFAAAGYDVTVEQWCILMQLWRQDGQRQQYLADNACKDKTSVTRLIDGLEKRNLVARVVDRVDRRQKFVYLTHRGRALQKELIPLVKKTLNEAQQGVDAKRIDDCKQTLREVYLNLAESR